PRLRAAVLQARRPGRVRRGRQQGPVAGVPARRCARRRRRHADHCRCAGFQLHRRRCAGRPRVRVGLRDPGRRLRPPGADGAARTGGPQRRPPDVHRRRPARPRSPGRRARGQAARPRAQPLPRAARRRHGGRRPRLRPRGDRTGRAAGRPDGRRGRPHRPAERIRGLARRLPRRAGRDRRDLADLWHLGEPSGRPHARRGSRTRRGLRRAVGRSGTHRPRPAPDRRDGHRLRPGQRCRPGRNGAGAGHRGTVRRSDVRRQDDDGAARPARPGSRRARGAVADRRPAERTEGVDAMTGAGPGEELIAAGYAWETADAPVLHDALNLADLAHAVELVDRGIVPAGAGRALLGALLDLAALPAADAGYDPAYGELYASREHHLTARIGADAGWLRAGRTRREAVRIALRITVRERLLDLVAAAADLAAGLADQAERQVDTLMPDYTYLQQAQPTTFGHYLLSFADPVLRDAGRLLGELGYVNA